MNDRPATPTPAETTATAYDAWHDHASRLAAALGWSLRDETDAWDAEQAFERGVTPLAFVQDVDAAL